jgi:5'(3')-deoxyribonucleotidase
LTTGKKIVGIDVDQTIIDTETLWTQWIIDNPSKTVDDFFDRPHLYDNININASIITQIRRLSKITNIVFISACFDSHIESKKNMLDRAFSSFMCVELINSKTKYEVLVDYMIDDRESVLLNMPNSVMCMKSNLFNVTSKNYEVLSWLEIYEKIKKDINVRT